MTDFKEFFIFLDKVKIFYYNPFSMAILFILYLFLILLFALWKAFTDNPKVFHKPNDNNCSEVRKYYYLFHILTDEKKILLKFYFKD